MAILKLVVSPAITKFAYEVDKSSNRITFGLIISGTLIAAAIIYNIFKPVAIGLLIISAIFTLFLLASILKERGGIKL